MNLSRLKKAIAGVSVAAISLSQAGVAFAAYSDVPADAWYKAAVDAFVDMGYLDASQSRFRGGDSANRAEFVKLVVELAGGILSTPPAVPSFDDVSTGAWYYGYMEEAGKEGWVRGDGDCYGSHPCNARPGANINRAEAAALIVRAFGLASTGDAPQFVDNASGQWYTSVIQTAADHCVLQGDGGTGRVRPGDNMNRAEMVVMLHRVDLGLVYGVDCQSGGAVATPMVTDVVATSATTLEVEFNRPLDQASAEDAGNYSLSPSIAIDSVVLVDVDVVEITLSSATTAGTQYTLTVDGVMTSDNKSISDAMTFGGYSPIVVGNGVLELSLSASNPSGDTVPKGAVGVTLLSVDFTASCADSISIENVTVLHEGRGDESDIDGIYAAINGARVSRKRTIDSEDQTADLRFSSPLVLDKCETVTVDIVADMSTSATTSAEHNLVLELPSDVIGNAKEVRGNFPLRGSMFKVAAITSGTVTVTYRTVSPDEVEVGDKGVVIGKFEVSINSVEDQTFYSATFEQNSSASDGDFVNIALRRTDGTVLTNTVAQSVGDFVTVVFDPPFTVLEGDKITLEIIADISDGAGDSIIMHFEESSDLFAVGSLYGYGVNGQLYGSQVSLPTETATLPDTVTIDAGELTIGINGPTTQQYTRDDNDAVLANIEVKTGGEKVDIKDFYVLILGQTSTGAILCSSGGASTATCGTAAADDNIHEVLEDVEIRNNTTGRTIDGVRLTSSGTSGQSTTGTIGTYQIYRFDDFIVNGDEVWEFRVDFIDNGATAHPTDGDKFKIFICGEPTHISTGANATGCTFGGVITSSTAYQMDVEGLSTGDRVLDIRPRGSIAGNFMEIANAALNIDVQSLITSNTIVRNADDVNFLRFEARAGEAEDILLTKLIFEAALGSATSDASNYTLWVDTDGDRTVDTILEDGVAAQGSTPTLSFAELEAGGYVIPAEETVVFEVHGDIASSPSSSLLQLRFATGSTYVEAEELDDGSSLSGIQTDGTCSSSCDIVVTTNNSTEWTIVAQGDLFVNKDSTSVRARQLLGGTLGETVFRIEMRAQNESVDVTDLRITSSGSTAASVDVLELYFEGATTPFATATRNGCPTNTVTTNPNGGATVKTFCTNMENDQLIVPDGQNVDILVRPRLFTNVNGATSGQNIQFFINNAHSVKDNGSGAVLARGNDSSNDLTANDYDSSEEGEVFIGVTSGAAANLLVVSGKHTTVLSKITSIVNANTAVNSAVPTGLAPFGQFSFTAAQNSNNNSGDRNAVLSGIVFNVSATNVEIEVASFKLYEKNNDTIKSTCTAYYSGNTAPITGTYTGGSNSGAILVDCNGLAASAVNTELSPGETSVFVLEANVTNANTSGSGQSSTLQASLQDFNDMADTAYGVASGRSHLQWRDTDSSGATSFTWIEYPESSVNSSTYRS